MAKASPALTSNNAGELGTTLAGRTDLSKYPNGCKRIENFEPLVQGPLRRRGGTRHASAVKDHTKRTWQERFEFSATQAYILEFGHEYLRFYTDHGPLLVSGVVAWSNVTAYAAGDLAVHLGVNYYCIAAHTNQAPPNATYWHALEADIYEIPTPWTLTDLTNEEGGFGLDIEQSADVLYVAGATRHRPRQLTRFDTTRWVLSLYPVKHGPFMEQNKDDALVMWASGKTGTVTVKANFNAFAATDVGRLLRLQSQDLDVPPWQASTRAEIAVGDLRRHDGRTYKALTNHETGTSAPIHESGVAKDGEDVDEDDGNLGVYWEFQDAGYGIVEITGYTSPTQVTATVILQLPANVVGVAATLDSASQASEGAISTTAPHGFADDRTVTFFGVGGMTQLNGKFFRTKSAADDDFVLLATDTTGFSAWTSGGTVVMNATRRWSLGAWSTTTGYPTVVSFAFERLFWGRGIYWWGSVPRQYADMSQDVAGLITPDCAVRGELSGQDVNKILWMIEAERLLIGTGGGEFALGPITEVDPLGPGNVLVKRQSKKRCRAVKPIVVDTSVIYVQRSGRRLLRMDYSTAVNRFVSRNMNALNPQITKSGIIDMAFQAEPDPIIWCVLGNGSLVGFTLDEEQDVTGWHRHPIGGNGFVESVECKPAPDGSREEVWIQVRRTINGATRRYYEFVEKPWEAGDDPADMFYVDSGLTYTGGQISTLTGLDHLEGQMVQILFNGAAHPDRIVSGGQVALAPFLPWKPSGNKIHAGLRATARVVKMPIEFGTAENSSQGRNTRIEGATLRVIDTLGGKAGIEGSELTEIQYREPGMPQDAAPPVYTGDRPVTFHGDYSGAPCIEIVQDQPFPMTLAAIYPRATINDAPK